MKNSMAGILGPKMAVIYVLSFGKKFKLKRLHTPRNAFGPASFILLN